MLVPGTTWQTKHWHVAAFTHVARHLCRTRGCAGVSLSIRQHLIPDPGRIREGLEHPGLGRVDIDSEEFYTAPQRIGDYPCDAS